MKAVILAGGMGIRLRPFTFSVPKPLLPVGEKPLLEIIIKHLKKFGFRELVLAIGYKSKMIEAYLGNGSRLGVRIHYLLEKRPSGTAGPLAQFRDNFKIGRDESFLLMNGDILTRLNFSKMLEYHKKNNFEITIGVKNIRERKSYGFVEVKDNLIKRITEKPKLNQTVNAGIYLIKSTAIKKVPRHRFFTMPNLINSLISRNRTVGAYYIKEYWLGLEELRHFEEVYNNKKIRQVLTKD